MCVDNQMGWGRLGVVCPVWGRPGRRHSNSWSCSSNRLSSAELTSAPKLWAQVQGGEAHVFTFKAAGSELPNVRGGTRGVAGLAFQPIQLFRSSRVHLLLLKRRVD